MYICLLAYSVVSVLGVLAWWLSFDTSSPLPIGGIAGSTVPVLLAKEVLLGKIMEKQQFF